MRPYRSVLLVGLSLLVLGLAGCQDNAHQSSASYKNASTSSKKYKAPKPDAAVTQSSSSKIAQSYKPKTAQTQSKNYVKSGMLKQEGQYTFDKVGTKLTLDKVHQSAQTIKSGQLTYRIDTVRVIRNVAETADAKKMAAQALDMPSIKSPYYTLQVKFTIINRGKRAVTTDGIKAIRLNDDRQISANNQLSDASAGQTIGAHKQVATFATGLAGQTTDPNLKQIKIAFSGAYSQKQKQLVKPTDWLTITLS